MGAMLSCSLATNPLPARLQEYRRKGILTDITIKVGEEQFSAHKIVLRDSSPVLKALLSDHWIKGDICEFSEQFVDSSIVDDLLTFFYTAEMRLTMENAHAISVAAHYLNVPFLLEQSEQFLSLNVSPENVLDLLLLADKLSLKTLRQSCIDCVLFNHAVVLKDLRIINFRMEDLQMLIIELTDRFINSEIRESLFDCVVSWVEHDELNRTPSLPTLLRLVSLEKLSVEYLSDAATDRNIFSRSLLCSGLLNEAFGKSNVFFKQPGKTSVYCFGGNDKDGAQQSLISCLNVQTGSWSTPTDMSQPRVHFGAATLGEKIYVFGGLNQEGLEAIDKVERYNMNLKLMSRLRSMPKPRAHCAAAELHGFIYVSGGHHNGATANTLYRYNMETDRWQEMTSMYVRRREHQLVALNGVLYAISGRDTKWVESYDPATDRWIAIAKTQYQHEFPSAAVHCDRIYVLSNRGFEVYSPDTDMWDILPELDDATGRTLVTMDGKLWAFGAHIRGEETSPVFSYDISARKWTRQPNMNSFHKFHRSFVVHHET